MILFCISLIVVAIFTIMSLLETSKYSDNLYLEIMKKQTKKDDDENGKC